MKSSRMWKGVVAIVVSMVMIGSIVITKENARTRRSVFVEEQIRTSPTHVPIYINGNAAMNASTDAPGDGTVGSPCIIENYQIDGGDSGSCIEIRNVNLYVIIRNCTLFNSGSLPNNDDSGIELFNCNNIMIMNCTIYYTMTGISGIYSSFITIENNFIHNNTYHGIWLRNTDSSIVKYNRIQGNSRHGIILESSSKNTISFNNCTSNGLRGIYFDTLTYDNTVFLNIFGLNIVSQAWDDGLGNTWDSPIGNRYSDYAIRYPLATNDGVLWNTPYDLDGSAHSLDTRPIFNATSQNKPISLMCNTDVDTFCSGNDTNGSSWATAYRISNYEISAGGGDYCIQLQNVDRHVIIENCILFTAYSNPWGSAGIKLQNCTNIKVSNCTIRYNSIGINIYSNNQHCIIERNNITFNSYEGIYVYQSYNLTVFNNLVKNNYINGIHMWNYCKDNNISLNTIEDSGINGLALQNELNTTIDGNWLVNNYIGCQIIDSGNLTVRNNQVVNSTNYGYGIFGSPGDLILDSNQIIESAYAGIYIWASNGVTLVSTNMTNASVVIEGNLSQLASYSIDTSNMVNNKPLYYYHGQNGLSGANFTNAGEVIIINCSNSLLSGIVCDSASNGIIVYYCSNTTVSSSSLTDFTSAGLFIDSSTNCTITGNSLIDCIQGISISSCTDIILTSNAFVNGGLAIDSTISECETYVIDTSNTVNNRPIRYYVSRSGLVESDFSNAGQIIMFNCNNSRVSNQNVSHGTYGIYCVLCFNNDFTSIDAHANHMDGARFQNCSLISVVGGTFSDSGETGIHIIDSSELIITRVVIDGCYWGVFLNNCANSSIVNNTISNCRDIGLFLSLASGNEIENNTICGTAATGAYINTSNFNRIIGNTIFNNNDSGIIYRNSKWNTFIQNDVYDNNYGVYLAQTNSHNVFYLNNFKDNVEYNAFYERYSDGTNNTWSNGTFGNFWGDYSSTYPTATMLNGTWSMLYKLNGSTTDSDPHPLVYPFIIYQPKGDFDVDGLTNWKEIFEYGSDPTDPDSDDDGIPDGYEISNGLKILEADGFEDADHDGLTNLSEYLIGTRADTSDTDGDGFSDKEEIDWGTNPLSGLSTPLHIIILIISVSFALIFVLILAVRARRTKQAVQSKKLTSSGNEWLDEEVSRGTQTFEEKIDEKRAILSRVMEPMTTEDLKADILSEMPDKILKNGKKKGSDKDDEVIHQVDEQTESEVAVFKKKESCIVCNAVLKATTFICPHCETKYCIRCAIALSDRKESCWMCHNPMNFNP